MSCEISIDTETEKLRRENAELRRALQTANAALEAKTSFLYNMSHDIRTPMNAIVGMISIAQNHLDERDRVRDCLAKLQTASGHLMSLINDVLDMSRIESGRTTVSEERFSLAELVHDLSVLLRPLAAAKRQRFRMDVAEIHRENLVGDPLYLRQVFMNIISNAVKYTPDGGTVEVRFSERPAEDDRQILLDFSCQDNGIGMSEDFLQRIFVPFERAENADQSKVEGTGLGMAITRRLVEQMGGDIHIESAVGEGSLFTVSVPLSLGEEDAASLMGQNVLVVESDAEQASAASRIIAEAGGVPVTLSSGTEAVMWTAQAQMEGSLPDAVIVGGGLGENAVLNLAQHLRSQLGEDVPILYFSYQDWSRVEYAARRAGITGFVPCPLFKGRLLRALSSPETDGKASERPDFTGMRVLLAEDNALNREIAVELIQETGASVDTAENGKEALERFEQSEEGAYDLILMDIQMPVMDGFEAVRCIRALPRADAVRVCIAAMTANAFVEDIKRSKEAGMDEHVSKPVDFSHIEELLRRCNGNSNGKCRGNCRGTCRSR